MTVPVPIDFDLLLDPDIPAGRWLSEMEKSAGLRAALDAMLAFQRTAAAKGIPVEDTDDERQLLFHFLVSNSGRAQRLHLGDITIPQIIEDRATEFSARIDEAMVSDDHEESGAEEDCDCPICTPTTFDREQARKATAGDGIDYGLLASTDAAWFVWRDEVDQTTTFRTLVERVEPWTDEPGIHDEYDRQREFMLRIAMVSRDADVMRNGARRILKALPEESLDRVKEILDRSRD